MKAIDIFCASPASTAICLSLDQRSLVRQGSRMLEQSHLLERQGSKVFEPSNTVPEPGRRSKSERPRRSTDRRRSNADQISKEQQLEQKPRRSRHRSTANSLSRFSCSAIDQSAIIPFKQPPLSKPVKTPVILNDPSPSSSSSSPGVTE
ncbi:hypothetical protein KI387_006660, partial [Taxus chinensis]